MHSCLLWLACAHAYAVQRDATVTQRHGRLIKRRRDMDLGFRLFSSAASLFVRRDVMDHG